jgi:HEPN domain-containing protein
MSVELQIANLLRIAKEDLDGARLLASVRNRNDIYLLEQAAEKVIKAVLTSEGEHAGIGHDLEGMLDKLPDANPLKPALGAIEHLAAYATTYRYATSTGRVRPRPSSQDFDDAAEKVDAALQDAAARFEVDLDAVNTPARNPGPIR